MKGILVQKALKIPQMIIRRAKNVIDEIYVFPFSFPERVGKPQGIFTVKGIVDEIQIGRIYRKRKPRIGFDADRLGIILADRRTPDEIRIVLLIVPSLKMMDDIPVKIPRPDHRRGYGKPGHRANDLIVPNP